MPDAVSEYVDLAAVLRSGGGTGCGKTDVDALPGEFINLLLTNAGRRNDLVVYFQKVLRGRGRVFTADANSYAPALQEADDAVVVPPVGDHHYLDALLEFCEQARIDLLIPLSVLELPSLAAARNRFSKIGTTVVVSPPGVIDRCFDKWQTYAFLQAEGLPTPKTYLTLSSASAALEAGELGFPLVLKPRWGAESVGLTFAQDDDELELGYDLLRRRLARTSFAGNPVETYEGDQTVLIQEFIVGDEYSLDIVNDLSGRYVTTFAKQKLGLRAGETEGAVTVSDERLGHLGATLGRTLKHLGPLECDVFLGAAGAHVLELNPCLGSDYPFAHVAGADLPAALIAWARGEIPDPAWLRAEAGISSARFSRLLLLSQT